MKHRYIFCGVVTGADKISDYRLISKCTKYSLGHCIRVNIPDDLKLYHYPGDGYSTTDDNRTLDQLGYDVIIFYKGKWRIFNDLKQYQPCHWSEILEYMYHLYDCFDDIGYTDDESYYTNWYRERMSGKKEFIGEEDMVWPSYKEYKPLDLPINIKEWPWDHDGDIEWFPKYKKYKALLERRF